MPVRQPSNNKILPANSRAVDVATRAINEITPVFQTRMNNAFRVQGSQGILYNRLEHGEHCTCGSTRHALATRLDQEGNLHEGALTELLTGMTSAIEPYGKRHEATITSPDAPKNKHQSMSDTHFNTDDLVIELFNEESFKDDGAKREQTLDDLVGNFDTTSLGLSDVACPVCFGTGFIGGFTPLFGYRQVVPVQAVELPFDAELNPNARPWNAHTTSATFQLLVPAGITSLDALRVLNMQDIVPAIIFINDQQLLSRTLFEHKGQTVTVRIEFAEATVFTHIEFQCALSVESPYFELPRMPQSGSLQQLDSTLPFTLLLSPNVPFVFKQDVIVEATTGRVLIVGDVSPWATKERHNLGHEVQVRVAQPLELYHILPRRGRTLTKPKTTTGVHDNSHGAYRT